MYANHTSNTGIKPNPEAVVTMKTVDIAVVHLIANGIEKNVLLSIFGLFRVYY